MIINVLKLSLKLQRMLNLKFKRCSRCNECPAHLEKIKYLTSTLSKFTLGRPNLEVVLGSQRRVINKQGISYTTKSNRINAKKFSYLRKPSFVTSFYYNTFGYVSKSCYYRKVRIPKGKFKWIPKEPTPATKSKGPKFIWVPESKLYDCFIGNWRQKGSRKA